MILIKHIMFVTVRKNNLLKVVRNLYYKLSAFLQVSNRANFILFMNVENVNICLTRNFASYNTCIRYSKPWKLNTINLWIKLDIKYSTVQVWIKNKLFGDFAKVLRQKRCNYNHLIRSNSNILVMLIKNYLSRFIKVFIIDWNFGDSFLILNILYTFVNVKTIENVKDIIFLYEDTNVLAWPWKLNLGFSDPVELNLLYCFKTSSIIRLH